MTDTDRIMPNEPQAAEDMQHQPPPATDDDGPDWLEPGRLPANADELQDWLNARSATWLTLLHQLGLEAFTVWELAQHANDAEATMKDLESGLAQMYSPACKAAEERFSSVGLATLYQEADRVIDELTSALRSVLRAQAQAHAESSFEDWEREELEAWLETVPVASPEAAPQRPRRFDIGLLQPGALALRFNVRDEPKEGEPDLCDPEPGVIYEVQRRVGGSGPFEHLMSTESLGFRDTTLPVGPRLVDYRVTPMRDRLMGPPGYARVRFFPEGNGASLEQNPPLS